MSEHPNTLREAYAQALRLTFGVARFKARMIITSQRVWRWVAIVALLMTAVSMPGYEFGSRILPYVLMTCVALLGHRMYVRARHALAMRRRRSGGFRIELRIGG